MRVVFGVGNPGPDYQATRHNVGFRVVDRLARGTLTPLPGLNADGAKVRLSGQTVLLVKPLTYVNRCGPLLEKIRREHGIPVDDLLVVVDDFALPIGRLRLRAQGSDGGHNGLASILAALQTPAFPRLRLGIGDPGELPAERYVLMPFPPEEEVQVEESVTRAAEAVHLWLRLGTENAMSEVNRRDLDQGEERP